MRQKLGLLALLVLVCLFYGCREDADSFFSGRPSGMAMAHNRVLDGMRASMIDLLRIPHRFPDVKDSHKVSWQESIDAWWHAQDGRTRILAALPELTDAEIQSFETWLSYRSDSSPSNRAATLDDIAGEIRSHKKNRTARNDERDTA